MNTLVIVLIAAVCLIAAYALYGRWIARTWGIGPRRPNACRPPERRQGLCTHRRLDRVSHQFSSIAGAGPVTGAIQAAAFGLAAGAAVDPAGRHLLGAVTDFGALYASVKNEGKSMGLLIEKYIGKLGRKLFLLFCWLFTLLVIAAFADMVAGTFNAFGTDGALVEAAQSNGAAGTISLLFIVFAMIFGLLQKKFRFTGWRRPRVGLVCTVAALALGMMAPIIADQNTWTYITFVYIFFAAVLPMWLLKQPRDYMTTFMFIGMIAGAVVGLLVAHPHHEPARLYRLPQ